MEVSITHHEVSDPEVACTADYPVLETIVPLGSDFETGVEYMVDVNSEACCFLRRPLATGWPSAGSQVQIGWFAS